MQVAVRGGHFLQVFRRNVDDDPLVDRLFQKLRLVDTAAADEHDVACVQQIALAINEIAALTGYQQQELAEFMIVIIHLFPAFGAQMEQTEIFQQIAPLFSHDNIPPVIFCKQYTMDAIGFAIDALF